jgi:hypothetical protein
MTPGVFFMSRGRADTRADECAVAGTVARARPIAASEPAPTAAPLVPHA